MSRPLVVALLVATFSTVIDGVILMALAPSVHHDWPAVPALGFWACWSVAIAAWVVLGGARQAATKVKS